MLVNLCGLVGTPMRYRFRYSLLLTKTTVSSWTLDLVKHSFCLSCCTCEKIEPSPPPSLWNELFRIWMCRHFNYHSREQRTAVCYFSENLPLKKKCLCMFLFLKSRFVNQSKRFRPTDEELRLKIGFCESFQSIDKSQSQQFYPYNRKLAANQFDSHAFFT